MSFYNVTKDLHTIALTPRFLQASYHISQYYFMMAFVNTKKFLGLLAQNNET